MWLSRTKVHQITELSIILFRVTIQTQQLHNLTCAMKSPWLRWSIMASKRSLEQRWHSTVGSVEQERSQMQRQGVFYAGWHSSLIVSNGLSWTQHNKAKCGSARGQDSYLVPMLSYLPCAILDILHDLCTQRCMHPLLPSEAWVMWKAREVRELPNWPFQNPWIWTAPYGPCEQRRREGGFSGSELYFLAWQSYTKTMLSAFSLYTVLPFHISHSDFPSSASGFEETNHCAPSKWLNLNLLQVLPSTRFSLHSIFFKVSSSGKYSLPLICTFWSIWYPSVTYTLNKVLLLFSNITLKAADERSNFIVAEL